MTVTLRLLGPGGLAAAQRAITVGHYLHKPMHAQGSVEGYAILCGGVLVGYLLVGRPQAPRCKGWYGDVADVRSGWAMYSRWAVLNLGRVYVLPAFQPGGSMFSPLHLPGYSDRAGWFRSTLITVALDQLVRRVGFDYLVRRPPCFTEEPYQISWLLSYCKRWEALPAPLIGPPNPFHAGTIYQAAGFQLYRTNKHGIQTWRKAVPSLTPTQDATIRAIAARHPRSIAYRGHRFAAATTAQGMFL